MVFIVKLVGVGQDIERLVSVEIAEVGKAEEELRRIRGKPQEIRRHIELLALELHHIKRLQSFIDTKMFRIITELSQIEGHLTAHHKQLHEGYKQLKLQQRTGENKFGEPQLQQYATIIRQIEELKKQIKTIKNSFINDIKRDMSTMRYIAQKAE